MGAIGRLLLLCAVTLTICGVSTAVVSEETMRRCAVQTSCGDCIRADRLCAWCADANYLNGSRCYAVDPGVPDTNCSAANRQNPMGRVTDTSSDAFENLNQIVPRRVGVTVRPGETITFPVDIRPANNFPIDLYLLMDLSHSMRDDLDNLKRLGSDIATRIKEISTNFQIGFGSFVDKKVGPYVNLDPRRLIDPCYAAGCETPYSFRQVVDLTNNSGLFEQRINEQKISGNRDFPEGGFDGFLQSIVCTDFVGWRDVSRKLLLYISDAGFHYAGDGKLGGIVRPHDGLCKMNSVSADENGNIDYQEWDTLDYPSVGQIADKLDQFDIIPIFAVVSRFQRLYQALVNQLGDRAYLGTLASDSSNVVQLIQTLYNQISQRIVFAPPNVPGVSITVSIADCSVGRIVDGVCQEVEIGETASFNISVQVTECTQELINGKEVEVRVLGFGTIVVNLTAICVCSCEAIRQDNSTECNNKGTLTCGSCMCNRGFFGEMCQCDASGLDNSGNIVSCPTGLDNKQCSGRGRCTCGICDCRTATSGNRFFGPACECDSNNCPVGTGGERCSGSSRGECTCDGCRCLTETVTGLPYGGADCSCTPNTASCRDSSNATDVCNGKGQCVCGQCQCVNPGPYFGTFCELCSGDPVCQRSTCDLDKSNAQCARCVVELLEPFNNRSIEDTKLFNADFVEDAIMNGTLPRGTVLGSLNNMTSEMAIFLPVSFSVECNNSCPQLVVINQTMLVDYEIMNIMATRCQYDPLDCNYRYYVALNPENGTVLPIHVEYPPVCLTTDSVTGSDSRLAISPWAIALIFLILLLVLGILALLLLKIILLVLDWIEVRKFEQELAKSKYTKNENPLYRSAQKEYKNPIYGQ